MGSKVLDGDIPKGFDLLSSGVCPYIKGGDNDGKS